MRRRRLCLDGGVVRANDFFGTTERESRCVKYDAHVLRYYLLIFISIPVCMLGAWVPMQGRTGGDRLLSIACPLGSTGAWG
jgi:hypothetical protein